MTSAVSAKNSREKISPVHVFWIVAGLHFVLWILVPALTSPNVQLDVIEGYAWGREWLIGTYKHPPMQAWWLEILAYATGRASWAHLLASQIAIVTAFWAVWQTGRRLAGDKTALLGVLLLEGAVYYNFTSPEFNPNVLQLPFWALACWSFHRAVKENRWFDWALLGVWGAGGLYTKYSMLVLLAVLAGLMIFHPEARRRLRGFGPYLALAMLSLLGAPHLKWLVAHDFQPFFYAESRTGLTEHVYERFLYPGQFLMAQGLSLLAMILLYALFVRGRVRLSDNLKAGAGSFDRVFLHAIALGPVALLLLLAVVVGFRPRDMWGACLWNFVGLWA
ncbi:MAG: glycosyltransferase family 39 protein, partial [Alphaproteobacteria bacterium]|nr:glycosyltransferase family 39 protein [Alphaproteobacteria bacterium]